MRAGGRGAHRKAGAAPAARRRHRVPSAASHQAPQPDYCRTGRCFLEGAGCALARLATRARLVGVMTARVHPATPAPTRCPPSWPRRAACGGDDCEMSVWRGRGLPDGHLCPAAPGEEASSLFCCPWFRVRPCPCTRTSRCGGEGAARRRERRWRPCGCRGGAPPAASSQPRPPQAPPRLLTLRAGGLCTAPGTRAAVAGPRSATADTMCRPAPMCARAVFRALLAAALVVVALPGGATAGPGGGAGLGSRRFAGSSCPCSRAAAVWCGTGGTHSPLRLVDVPCTPTHPPRPPSHPPTSPAHPPTHNARRPPVVAPAKPSCAAHKAAGASVDGYYSLTIKSVVFPVWCQGMSSASPKEYVDVPVSCWRAARTFPPCSPSCRSTPPAPPIPCAAPRLPPTLPAMQQCP